MKLQHIMNKHNIDTKAPFIIGLAGGTASGKKYRILTHLVLGMKKSIKRKKGVKKDFEKSNLDYYLIPHQKKNYHLCHLRNKWGH